MTDVSTQIEAFAETVAETFDQLGADEDVVQDVREHGKTIADEVGDLEDRVDDVDDTAHEANALAGAVKRKANANADRVAELQSRELEKGAHLLEENVDIDTVEVDGGKLERITKDDRRHYFRLPGENDALERGGAVAHATADLLPIQRLARYDDDMLASVTNRKPDELAAKAWRKRDDAGRHALWSKGSNSVRCYLNASELAQWIRVKEDGVSKKYSQELARRTMDAMIELAKGRLGKTKTDRRKDGLAYRESRVVLKADVDLPGEIGPAATSADPTTNAVAGRE